MIRTLILTLTLSTAAVATAAPFDIATSTGLFTPSFRGAADSTWTGWELFGSSTTLINDTTPDIGTHPGSFITTNGEDHVSGSFNYYSLFGTVAEDVTFTAPGPAAGGFTTVIVQAKTLPGFSWNDEVNLIFGPIDGVAPTQALLAESNSGFGQLFVKYEIPGTVTVPTFSLSSSGADSHTSFDQFVVDAYWSADGFAIDSAIATPEPATTALLALAASAGLFRRK
jgi:hypothetical protein